MENRLVEVLVVDDDEVDRLAVRRALRRISFRVNLSEAADGIEALDYILSKSYDCILLDYHLPDMNGLEILRRIREKQVRRPVVMLTGQGDEQLAVEIMKMGATDYLVKGRISSELLEKSITNAMRVFEAEEKVFRYQQHLEELVEERTAELKKANDRLVEVSHRAGMAEVAADILHGVGNVLNSVKVAAAVIDDTLQGTRLDGLAKVSRLLGEQADLANFFASDSRGQMIPSYLEEITKLLEKERDCIREQSEELTTKVQLIEKIVSAQQNYIQWIKGIIETCEVETLVEDALRITEPNREKWGIEVERYYGDIAPITVESHKVEQILVHLITNAINALEVQTADRKIITIRSIMHNGHVRIMVRDNGTGIREEHLTKIFNQGFTTREEGHGFGLHSCANLARELGGSLSVHSDGPNRGATFTLDMPVRVKGMKGA